MTETTIPTKKKTKQRLKKHGFLNETWDDALSRLMKHAEECDNYFNEVYP